MTVQILIGDALAMLGTLADESVHCCVTSPPYYGLRDYGIAGQMGSEPTLTEYIAGMVEVFREVRRVLRRDGTCWLNVGDSYATGTTVPRNPTSTVGPDVPASWSNRSQPKRVGTPAGLKSKDLLMVPARLAIALQDDGWWVRKDIIWAKPNPMPESCTDRPSSSHEHVFLLAKAERYFYDAEAIRERRTSDEDARTFRGGSYTGGAPGKREVVGNRRIKVPGGWDRGPGAHGSVHREGRTSAEYVEAEVRAGRNMRDVWTIATSPFPEAHFATFPPELPERCIKAGTSERGCCPACASPYRRIVAKGAPDIEAQRAAGGDADGEYHGQSTKDHAAAGVQDASAVKARILAGMRERLTVGWKPTCGCAAEWPLAPAVVLDPFLGAGTTALVADRLGRDAIGIELNPEYAEMAKRRIKGDAGMFASVA